MDADTIRADELMTSGVVAVGDSVSLGDLAESLLLTPTYYWLVCLQN